MNSRVTQNGLLELQLFSFGKDFSYHKFLEHQSHFDRIELKIDDGIRSLITSNKEIGKEVAAPIEELRGSVSSGFDMISSEFKSLSYVFESGLANLDENLRQIHRDLEDISRTLEFGFSGLEAQLSDIHETLEELLATAMSPEQTRANEQFSIARDLIQRGFVRDGLAYLDRAINGEGLERGYKFSSSFYFLRGATYLENPDLFDSEELALEAACNEFGVAVKYARPASPQLVKSRSALSWVRYCMGDLDASSEIARSTLRDAENVFPKDSKEITSERYQLAKFLFASGDVGEAAHHLSDVLKNNVLYALKAGADPDFLARRDVLEKVIQQHRLKEMEAVEEIVEVERPRVSPKISDLVRKYSEDFSGYDSFAKIVREFFDQRENMTIFDLSAVREASKSFGCIGGAILSARRSVSDAISECELKWKNEVNKANDALSNQSKSFEYALVGGSIYGSLASLIPPWVFLEIAASASRQYKFGPEITYSGIDVLQGALWVSIVTIPIAVFLARETSAKLGAKLVGGFERKASQAELLAKERRNAAIEPLRNDLRSLDVVLPPLLQK